MDGCNPRLSQLENRCTRCNDGAPRAPQSAALAALHRSGKCKIDVNIIQSYALSKDLSLIFTVLAHLSRIRTLRLSVQAEAHCVDLLEFHKLAVFLRTPAPVLEELTLTSFILMPNEDETPLRLGFEDDIIWFNGASPQLHSIALNYPPSDLAGVHGQHLTSLELRSPAAEIAPRISFSTLLNLLSETKKLQTLTVDRAVTFEHGAPAHLSKVGRVSLANLSISTLTFDLPDLLRFLAAVSVPSTSETCVVLTSFGELPQVLEALSSYLLDGIQPVSMMRYSLQEEYQFQLVLWTSRSSGTEYKQYLSIVLPIDTHPTFSGLDTLPLSHLRILHFSQSQKDHDFEFPDPGEIFRWCYTLDRLTDLALEAEFVDFFIDFAKEEIDCFPALKSLSTWLSHRDEAYQTRILDSLHGFLDQRASFTTPMKLQRLSVANLGVYEEPISGRIHKFKGLVRSMEAGGQILW
ncbi:hypothetical protein BDN72DRAFT_959013 [Pluteus cervinus]|uniref:Uncharacterized protein n=1 Tax=Pluteus cervinus TaxID=181527 RepID=A0ACD3AWX5_9AGAR|nr:hypothetical protein BDN72DRAFT_959013 [Pluteus cervinus]